MDCVNVNTFFSCSFRKDDTKVNDFFKTICNALELHTHNIAEGYCETPPEIAKEMINKSKVVIGILTRRNKLEDNSWTTSNAVQQEISMAFSLEKPTLLFIEKGVAVDGFLGNYGTYLEFERDNLLTNEFLKNAIKSIHTLRMKTVDSNNLLGYNPIGYFADSVNMLIELTKDNNIPIWKYNTTRKLIFTKEYKNHLKNVAWIDNLPEDATELIDYTLNVHPNDELTKYEVIELKNVPNNLELAIEFDPSPKKDDWVEIDFEYKSKHFNIINKKDELQEKHFILEDKRYDAIDGMIPIQPTRELFISFRFPSWYKIDKESIFPFVGSYSGGIDYIAHSEIARCEINRRQFGGSLQIDLRIENPLMRHVYGVAWNVKSD